MAEGSGQPGRIPASVDETVALLAEGSYVAGRDLATAVYLALSLPRPLLLEGEAGTGKTEVAKVLADRLGRRLLRLQCYDGLDLASAAYEWDYPRQMLAIRLAEARGEGGVVADDIYSSEYLVKRPLLEALEPAPGGAPVLLIDELDRADEPFEAFLLEILSDNQITIPEFGRVAAPEPPVVVITSNRTREIHDALRRRCLYHWVDYPSAEAEREILARKCPAVTAELGAQIIDFVQGLRQADLYKRPGVAETLDWAAALAQLGADRLDAGVVDSTLGALLKYQDDIARVRGEELGRLLGSEAPRASG
ncbi:AAA family ATPase [Lentisalinibacter salinarum]|uniref:AAA family ATPase n=1 Tax=Lentisalinibacter salinarum TaxID=2992239 RepID=UPI00386EF8E1